MSLYVPWLADAARSAGLRVVEVANWRSRGHGAMRLVEGVVGHHTATAASAPGDYPSLNIVTAGRSDLAGPLCNLGLGRDGTVYVVAAGVGWHAGASAWAGYSDLNDEFLGIEAESPGHGEWTDAQRNAYPRLVAALLRYMSRGVERYAGHKDVCLPKGRKIDPVGIDTGWMQATARNILAGGGTPAIPKEAEGMDPKSLPYSAVAEHCAFPIEVGSNSAVVKEGWVSLLSTFGASDYELIAIDGGVPGAPFDGPVLYDNNKAAPSKGTLGENSRLFAKLKDGCDGIALIYKNNTPGARLGISFPHTAK